MPEVLDWQRADPRVVLHRAARLLTEGQLVAFPTEAVYTVAASALLPTAVAQLQTLSRGADYGALMLAVGGPGEALDWAPQLSHLGRRLARRCWPGPLVLLCGDGVAIGLASRLPDAVRPSVTPDTTVRLRTPAHEAILQVMRMVPWPLVLSTVHGADGRSAATAGDAREVLGDQVALIIDDGPSRFSQPLTEVRVAGERWDVVREGVLSVSVLQELLPCRIVFVCTGNTCRSPLAAALCKKLLAERLGCTVEELPGRGFLVLSAGLAAMMGNEATAEAVATAQELGVDLADHRSQPLTAELLTQADHLITMTRHHLRALAGHGARGGPTPRLLAPDGQDVADPIGGAPEVYRECAQQILQHLQELLPELQ